MFAMLSGSQSHKSFQQAMPYINIEDSIVQDALRWLSIQQAANGSFPEVGKVIHQDMQGGSAKGLALTAYTLIVFLENQVRREIQTCRLLFNIILLSNAWVFTSHFMYFSEHI
jgi:hypothetical protein